MEQEIKNKPDTTPATGIDTGIDLSDVSAGTGQDHRQAFLRADKNEAVAEEFGPGATAQRGSVIIARGEQPDGAMRPITGLYPAGNAPESTDAAVNVVASRGAVRSFQDREVAAAA